MHNWVVVLGERDFRAVDFEKVLVDVEARPEVFECGFEALHCIFLFSVVETLKFHASKPEHRAEIAALGQKRVLIPEPIQIHVVTESSGFLPWLDDPV
jgi:hypothetical protein